jgi:hypothetical protein
MSNPDIKGLKRASARAAPSRTGSTSATKSRKISSKKVSHKPIAKRTTTEKAPVRKADKAVKTRSGTVNKAKPAAKAVKTKSPAKSSVAASKNRPSTASKPAASKSVKTAKSKATPKVVPTQKIVTKPAKSPAPVKSAPVKSTPVKKVQQPKNIPPANKITAPIASPTSPTSPRASAAAVQATSRDEASALRAFEDARKEFSKGEFALASKMFRLLIDKFVNVSEVVARAHTYLRIAESRIPRETDLPHDADSLYDHGVIELNRGQYATAQEMFERALQKAPNAAHIHYGLASVHARNNAKELALESLKQAITLDPYLRIRAQQDPDLTFLREDPDFESLIFMDK